MGVPEDGDELVSIDLRFDRAERRVATLVCERGAHWIDVKGGREGGQGEEKGEHIRKKVLRRAVTGELYLARDRHHGVPARARIFVYSWRGMATVTSMGWTKVG